MIRADAGGSFFVYSDLHKNNRSLYLGYYGKVKRQDKLYVARGGT